MNIIVVDDEEYAVKAMEKHICKINSEAKLRCFIKASEAIDYAMTEKIDIAFLDIKMRVMDGITMAKKLKEINPKINIIFCTGYDDYALEGIRLYCSAYLTKPITTEMVKEALVNLRYPVMEAQDKIHIQCYGDFEIYFDNVPVKFKYKRTKELLAYLVKKNGADVTVAAIEYGLFEEEGHTAYIRQLKKDLIDTLTKLGAGDVIRVYRGIVGVNREKVKCDYFDYKDGKIEKPVGEFMEQFRFD